MSWLDLKHYLKEDGLLELQFLLSMKGADVMDGLPDGFPAGCRAAPALPVGLLLSCLLHLGVQQLFLMLQVQQLDGIHSLAHPDALLLHRRQLCCRLHHKGSMSGCTQPSTLLSVCAS